MKQSAKTKQAVKVNILREVGQVFLHGQPEKEYIVLMVNDCRARCRTLAPVGGVMRCDVEINVNTMCERESVLRYEPDLAYTILQAEKEKQVNKTAERSAQQKKEDSYMSKAIAFSAPGTISLLTSKL